VTTGSLFTLFLRLKLCLRVIGRTYPRILVFKIVYVDLVKVTNSVNLSIIFMLFIQLYLTNQESLWATLNPTIIHSERIVLSKRLYPNNGSGFHSAYGNLSWKYLIILLIYNGSFLVFIFFCSPLYIPSSFLLLI